MNTKKNNIANTSLNFDDLQVREQVFTLLKKKYLLREASEHAYALHNNARAKAMKINDNKISGFGDIAEADVVLVSACLFELKNDGDTTKEIPLGQNDVRRLPSRAVRQLVNWIKENSDMDQFEDTEEGLTAQISLLQERLTAVRRLKGKAEGVEGGGSANVDPRLSTDPNDPNGLTPGTTGT